MCVPLTHKTNFSTVLSNQEASTQIQSMSQNRNKRNS